MSGIYRPVDPWNRNLEVSAPAKPRLLHTDHIPALRGLFALARGNYATVTPRDIQAAVDAGYLHPDVLSVVADEIAYATGTDEAEIEAGQVTEAEEPTSRSVSDLSFDYNNACLDFVFEDRARWVRLYTRTDTGGEAYVDPYQLKQVLQEVAPDLTCRELSDIEHAISAWLEEPVWEDCTTTAGEFFGEIIAARTKVRSTSAS